jgi:uncharacterized integral membrane protein
MRYAIWLLRLALFVLIVAFAVKNTDPVMVRFYLGAQWEAPLVIVILVVFVVGAAAGVAATLGHVFRQRREVVQLRKQLRSHAHEDGR